MTPDREFNRRMVRTVFTVAGVAFLIAVLWTAREALMLIYVSALLAMGLSPFVRSLQRPRPGRKGAPRWLAILTIYTVILGVIVTLALLVLPPLVAQAVALWADMPAKFNKIEAFLIQHHVMTHRITLEEAVQNVPAGSGNAVGTALGAIWRMIGGVFGLITILILSFYLLIEAESLFDYVIRFVPSGRRGLVATASREAVYKVSAWLRAQFVLAGVMGTFVAVGLGFMNVPYFYVVALIAAIGETIPIIGPIIAGVSAVTVALTVSAKLALMVGLYFLVLHQLETNILVPQIMERRVGVSPVTVMIALLIGGDLWGLVGAILAIPTAAILSVVVDEFSTGIRSAA
jgi:predicted PurR-regulated permease PerM